MSYIIDTCSLTTLYRVYPIDVFERAWQHVESLIADGTLRSSEEVFNELEAIEDRLLLWAKAQRSHGLFLELSDKAQLNAKMILRSHPNLLDLRKLKSSADVFLIAQAMELKLDVVTEEQPSGGPQRSKIPDVCLHYKVRCIPLLEMLRETGLKI